MSQTKSAPSKSASVPPSTKTDNSVATTQRNLDEELTGRLVDLPNLWDAIIDDWSYMHEQTEQAVTIVEKNNWLLEQSFATGANRLLPVSLLQAANDAVRSDDVDG